MILIKIKEYLNDSSWEILLNPQKIIKIEITKYHNEEHGYTIYCADGLINTDKKGYNKIIKHGNIKIK